MKSSTTAVLVSLLAATYQFYLRPLITIVGYTRTPENLNNQKCHIFDNLQACEKLVLHQPSHTLYLACSTIPGRAQWTPSLLKHNASGMSHEDYVAKFQFDRQNPTQSKTERLEVEGIDPTELSLHGMGINFASSFWSLKNDPKLDVFLNNHRAPKPLPASGSVVANSTIEHFRSNLHSNKLQHVGTYHYPEVITTPNDIAVSEDAKGFWFTNEAGNHKDSWVRRAKLHFLFGRLVTLGSIGYCSTSPSSKEPRCKIVASGISCPNGIARNGTQLVVASAGPLGRPYIYDILPESEGEIRLKEDFQLDMPQDNVVVDAEGSFWFAGFPNAYQVESLWEAPETEVRSSSGIKVSASPEGGYKTEKVFEDPGEIASMATTVVYDTEEKLLYVSGVLAKGLAVCEL